MRLIPLFIITIILLSVFSPLNFTVNAAPAEQLSNISFEAVANWVLDMCAYNNTVARTGLVSMFLATSMGHFNQVLATPIDSDGNITLSFWTYWHGDANPTIYLGTEYNDTTNNLDAVWLGDDTPHVWTQHNKTSFDANKFIDEILITTIVDDTPTVLYDDFSLMYEAPPPPDIPIPTSLTISDMDTTNNVYSMRKYYSIVASATTVDDPANITGIYVVCKQTGTDYYFSLSATDLDVLPVYAIDANATIVDLDTANCAYSVVGGVGTVTFKLRTEWDFPDESNLDLYMEAENILGASGMTLMQTDYFDVIGTLVATMTTGTPDVPLNQVVNIYGNVYYPTTVGGLVASAFYPPNAVFTGVELYEGATLITTDNAIVNGYYDVSFTPAIVLMAHTYHLELDMTPDFVDGEPANTPTLVITVSNNINALWAGIQWLLDKIFLFFGIVPELVDGVLTSPTEIIVDWITAMASWFIKSVVTLIDTIDMLGSIIVNGGLFLLDWGGKVATIVVQVTGIVKGLLDGTGYTINGVLYVFPNGLGNVWTVLGGTNMVSLLPLLIIVYWLQSLDSRAISTGQNHIALAIGDAQTAFGLISIFTWFAMLIYSTVFSIVQWVFSLIAGVFT